MNIALTNKGNNAEYVHFRKFASSANPLSGVLNYYTIYGSFKESEILKDGRINYTSRDKVMEGSDTMAEDNTCTDTRGLTLSCGGNGPGDGDGVAFSVTYSGPEIVVTASRPDPIIIGNIGDRGGSIPTGGSYSDGSNISYGGGGSATSIPKIVTPNFVLPKTYETLYPRFTQLVKDLKNFVKNDRCVMEALKIHTGFTESQILNYVTYGQGPEIKIFEGGGPYGYFNSTTTGPNVLNINANFVRGLEQATLSGTQKATAFLLAVTILHESVHYARHDAGLDESKFEYGWGFENDAFGITIGKENASNFSIRLEKGISGKVNYKCN